MARPRKDQAEPAATERIKEAFWKLLEENDLKHITVNMITQQAGCNRGTFYYHFDSLDDLLYAIIEEQLLSSGGLPRDLFGLLSNEEKTLRDICLTQRIQRFGLMMKQAGHECVGPKVKTLVSKMWEEILCPNEGEELTENSRVMIEFSISGLIGVIDYLYREGRLGEDLFPAEASFYLKENARFLFLRISQAQGISLGELEQRMALFLKMRA